LPTEWFRSSIGRWWAATKRLLRSRAKTSDALGRLRNKLAYARIAHSFLAETFTLAQLREVYEAVLGRELDPGNFRRMVEGDGIVEPTGERLAGTRHRPPQLYRATNTATGETK
jgi:8-oxo-dGTP diphosphatase